jgi:hypothetical protein
MQFCIMRQDQLQFNNDLLMDLKIERKLQHRSGRAA